MNDAAPIPEAEGLVAALGGRSIVLIGMMGAGKTSVGKRLGQIVGDRGVISGSASKNFRREAPAIRRGGVAGGGHLAGNFLVAQIVKPLVNQTHLRPKLPPRIGAQIHDSHRGGVAME